ncbi:hypothetical protein ACFORG_04010 [Lutimaribacter marinistellae]|uniref:Uncharacterized protein n=1 Tax=Lutimaribacter marinistellae TaxID=1820329 RepID=A0ABV7TDN5_9RHOB
MERSEDIDAKLEKFEHLFPSSNVAEQGAMREEFHGTCQVDPATGQQ